MAERVADEGSPSAPIVLIGEAPGRWEMIYGRPFVGPSYTDRLLPWWNEVELKREQFYITNVLDYQPARIDAVPEREMRDAMEALHGRIASLPGNGPIVIVPTGNYALYALTGKGRVAFHNRDGRWLRPGITEWRGSILEYQDARGRRIKVIPTIHPAATFRVPQHERRCRADWKRIAGDAQFRELRLPQRTHLIRPSAAEAVEWIRWTRASAADAMKHSHLARVIMSLDVETPKRVEYETREGESAARALGTKCRMCGHTYRWHEPFEPQPGVTHLAPCHGPRRKGCAHNCIAFAPPLLKPKRVLVSETPYLGCIGYSWDPKLSLTIPTTLAYWQDPAEWARVREEMVALHADPNVEKVMQNGSYDAYWCATEGMPVVGYVYDLMNMHRVRAPSDDQHDLAYQASLYTRQPYWKDEAKDPDSVAKYAHNNDALWTYNGIDNCVQRELLDSHLAALRDAGRLDYYREMDAALMEPLMAMSLHGIRVDESGRAKEMERVTAEATALAKEINEAAGEPIMGKIAVSNAKMRHFLYETLRLPAQYAKNAKKEKVVSTNIVAIKRLMERFPQSRLVDVGNKVLAHRRLLTIRGFVKPAPIDPDGRLRAAFVSDTLLGRLKSMANPRGTGRNLQNIDRRLRHLFLPDEGEA